MFDLKNRKYKKVFGFCPEEGQVCFEMENGLAYLVDLGARKVYVHADPWDFFKMDANFEIGSKIPRGLLEKATEFLETAEIPKLSKDRITQFKRILNSE